MFASLRTPIALFVTLTRLVEFLPDPSPRLPQVPPSAHSGEL